MKLQVEDNELVQSCTELAKTQIELAINRFRRKELTYEQLQELVNGIRKRTAYIIGNHFVQEYVI
jgi:ABC-type siderophore export system fused ATPase/permease subunit